MTENEQLLLNFKFNKSYSKEDYFVSESNFFAFNLVESWPKWERNIVNICGEKYSGKTHLSEIFSKKSKCKVLNAKNFIFNEEDKLRYFENIVLDNLDNETDENSIFSLINFIDQNNKYLLINSIEPINQIAFKTEDLKSRSKNCLIAKIDKPDDNLIRVLISKCLTDRQVTIDKKLIEYITKRITRSYGKIFEFIYKIDEMSLKKKRSINIKTIKEALGAKFE
ncbi:DNA replication protein [Pelagibacterales bacterium SAG-MED15]|nr:DNA replication protein [Pelagibacterales bacterium SAG-MED15]